MQAVAGWDAHAEPQPRDLVPAGARAPAGLHGRAGDRRPGRHARGDGRARRRRGGDQPADPGRARHRPLRAGGRVRLALRPLQEHRARVRAEPRALRLPALGPDGVRQLQRRAAEYGDRPSGEPRVPGPRRRDARGGRAPVCFPGHADRHRLPHDDGQRPGRPRLGRRRDRGGGRASRRARLHARPAGRRLPAHRASCRRGRPRPTSSSRSPRSCGASASSGSSSSTSATGSSGSRSPTAPPSGTCRRSTGRRAASSRSTRRRFATCASPAAAPEQVELVEAYCRVAGPLPRPGLDTRVLADRRARPRRRRAEPRRAAPSAGPGAAHGGKGVLPRRRSRASASPTGTAPRTRRSPTRSPPATRPTSPSRATQPLPEDEPAAPVAVAGARAARPCRSSMGDESFDLEHGSVVIAAITSCTNTSNPSVMVAAGLLAKNAVERGLARKPWVKSSLAPGSKVVTEYYDKAGLTPFLEALGFHTVGYGCTTCIGNSGPLPPEISERDRRGRARRLCRPLRQPQLRGAHPSRGEGELPRLAAARGRLRARRAHRPRPDHGADRPRPGRHDVFLRDLWPTPEQIKDTIAEAINEDMYRRTYADVFTGDENWAALAVPEGDLFAWDPDSTYVRLPPYFEGMSPEPGTVEDVAGARCLVMVGDSVTTDHISPAGAIKPDSPAGRYLLEHGVERKDFNSYGSRRGKPRGDGARDVRQRPAPQPARSRERGHVDRPSAGRRGDDDLRRGRALPGRGRPDGRARRQGVRVGLVARLGGEGAEPPRRPRRDRRELRAHPPLEPDRDGHRPAPVPRRRERRDARASPAARCSQSRASRTARRARRG